MSYRAYNVARLHGRDLVFLVRYLKEKGTQLGKKKRLILCNSYPKSGTHLLYQILYSTPGLKKWDDIVSVQSFSGFMNTASHIRWKIGSAPNDSIIRSHLTYCEEVQEVLEEHDVKRLFIYRDLRDVALSHARFILKQKRMFLYPIYRDNFKTLEERLMASIVGVPLGTPFGSNMSYPNIGQDFERWKGWIDDPNTLALRFEDLVGERGGGCEETRLDRIEAILDHLGMSMSRDAVAARYGSTVMDPTESKTFKRGGGGRIGTWEDTYTEEHKKAFKRVAGEHLIDLGYETDFNW